MIVRFTPATLIFLLVGGTASFAADGPPACPSQNTPPSPVKMTHFPPYYPMASVRAGEHGQTLLAITVGKDGTPGDIRVVGSSGSTRLDEAASAIVSSKWRWYPFPSGCEASSGQIDAVFGWFLEKPPQSDFGLIALPSQYPEGAIERYETGSTYLAITLDDAGVVTDGSIAYSSGYADLDEKALALLKKAQGIFAGKAAGNHIALIQWKLPQPQRDDVASWKTELLVISSRRIPDR